MIEKMTKYGWIVPASGKDAFLQQLREMGVVDITRSDKPVDERSEQMLGQIEEIREQISHIVRGSDPEMESLLRREKELSSEVSALSHWGDFSIQKIAATGIDFKFYCADKKKFNESWKEQYALAEIDRSDGKVWFVVLGADDFPLEAIPTPTRTEVDASTELKDVRKEIEQHRNELEAQKDDIPSLKEKETQLRSDLSAYLASLKATSAAQDSLCIYEGFAPSELDASLQEQFDSMEVITLAEPAEVQDNPPIKLRNNKYVKMFEVLTDMYGRPSYDGFDPTPFISIFFLLFFAMCIGDAGYGVILVVVGLLLKKVKSFASLAPLVVALGIGTTVVGIFFHTIFSMNIREWTFVPQWLKGIMVPDKIGEFDGTMIVSLAVGVIHLLLAMIVKTIYATKNKGFVNSLSTWGWTIFWTGLAVIGICALAGVIDSNVTKWSIIIVGIICAIGIFPLNNIHRNPLINIGSGLWDSYNMATGILGDVLSYLRLYALGLAGAMLGFAFNDLAAMARGDAWWGWIFFVLIVLVGHTLNIAMAALGAFVHPLRLNFLEFFKNSDYQGTGLKYNPLKK